MTKAPIQYGMAFTEALQFVWGEGFMSPGGPEEIAQMLEGHDLTGKRVLDVGSGVGGIDALLASEYGAREVIGIDVEEPLVEAARALIARRGLAERVRFQLVEPGPLPFPDNAFDAVFTKDALVHIVDKGVFFRDVLRVLKPGGAFIAADWLWSAGAGTSAVVDAWLSAMTLKFVFTTVPEAEAALRAAGFTAVAITDHRADLQRTNREEIRMLEGPARQRLAARVGEAQAMGRLNGARGRQGALDSGDLIPCHFSGRKPG